MQVYTFDRSEFNWAEEYYDLIQKKMGLPEWFGKNADALWDMLTGFIATPCEIVLSGFNKQENAYNRHLITLINATFQDAAKQYPTKFKLTIK